MTFLFLLAFGSLLETTVGLIPRPCRDNLTRPVAICCPIPEGRTLPCGGPGFGACQRIQVRPDTRKADWSEATLADDRFDWPTRLFQYGCHCEGNRWGFACHECWFGWKGADCQRHHVSIRRDYRNYTAQEKKLYQNVLVKLYEAPSKDFLIFEEKENFRYDPLKSPIFLNATMLEVLVFIHRYASRTTLYKSSMDCFSKERLDFIHGDAGFLTWHRFFILMWERQAAKMAREEFGIEDFSFPYWDWTDAKSCDPCSEDMAGDLSDPRNPRNPFKTWKAFCEPPNEFEASCIGCHTILTSQNGWPQLWRKWKTFEKFPTKKEVDFTLSRPLFHAPPEYTKVCLSFSHALEGSCFLPSQITMHNAVHDYSSGPFSTSGGSPNDPLFPLHHTQIDRILSAWFRKNREMVEMPSENVAPGQCRDCNLIGSLPAVPNRVLLVDTKNLGYDYDNFKFGV